MTTVGDFDRRVRREAHQEAQSVLRAGVPADANGDRDCRACKHYGHSGDFMNHGYCAHPHAQKLNAGVVSPSYMHSLVLCTNRAAHLFEQKEKPMPKAKWKVGDLIRYGDGCTALMRITNVRDMGKSFGEDRYRYYGRGFHSTGTCTGRYEKQCCEPSALDKELWVSSHDDNDKWIKGKW